MGADRQGLVDFQYLQAVPLLLLLKRDLGRVGSGIALYAHRQREGAAYLQGRAVKAKLDALGRERPAANNPQTHQTAGFEAQSPDIQLIIPCVKHKIYQSQYRHRQNCRKATAYSH